VVAREDWGKEARGRGMMKGDSAIPDTAGALQALVRQGISGMRGANGFLGHPEAIGSE